MTISWYPGHMHKARKRLAETMRNTDIVLEILDARAPQASANPLLAQLRGELPCIRVLSKADLADPALSERWLKVLNRQPRTLCFLSSTAQPLDKAALLRACNRLVERKASAIRPCQALITGIPNVGKSTLMNRLLGRKVARTGNEPAVTRDQQRVRLDEGWHLVDSPGMMWPRLDDQPAAYRLACLGTIRNTAIDLQDVAWFAAEQLIKDFFPLLQSRYSLGDKPGDVEQLLTDIAIQQGCLRSGGAVDWQRVSTLLLEDLRSGRLGPITLEAPPAEP